MKKFFLSSFIILTFTVYAIRLRQTESRNLNIVTTPPTTSPLPPDTAKGVYKDGEYTGDSADAYYGNVQIRVTILGGKITNVKFLDYPRDRDTSIEISSQAIPRLSTETIQAQSAQVDIVSGATQTSRAFRQSLQSALLKAKIL